MKETKEINREACLSDEAIIDLYWQREERAISVTDQKYGRYLYTIAYNIVRNSADCEECLNDTYLGTWNRIPPAKPSVFQVFLSKIMRNIAVDRWRHNTADKRIPSGMTTTLDELDSSMVYEMSAAEEYLVREVGRVLNEYLKSLSDREEFLFMCRYYYSDSVRAIADMLKMSERTVYRDLAKIREGLRARLEEEGIGRE